MEISCKECGQYFEAENRKFSLCTVCKIKREEQICPICGRVFNKKEEFKDHLGIIDRQCCKICTNERQYNFVDDLINRIRNLSAKYQIKLYKASLEDFIHFNLKISRNDVRAFGYKTGLVSKECYNKKVKTTDDHINGMTSIITSFATKVLNNEIITIKDGVDFLNIKSCTVVVSRNLNITRLRCHQNDEKSYIDPNTYYKLCEGIYYNDKPITQNEFLIKFEPYFL